MIFHCVKHSASYNAQDCFNKLLPQILLDSTIAKKVSCGRTKSEAVVKEILGALAEKYVEDVFKAKEGNEFSDVYFNVMTNKGNRKMYPILFNLFLLIKVVKLDFWISLNVPQKLQMQ